MKSIRPTLARNSAGRRKSNKWHVPAGASNILNAEADGRSVHHNAGEPQGWIIVPADKLVLAEPSVPVEHADPEQTAS